MAMGSNIFNAVPGSAPGIDGLRYTAGNIFASMTGGYTSPYVAPNQGTYEALVGNGVNSTLYSTMMSNTYGQLGRQIGNTIGGMELAQRLGSSAGMSPADVRRALANGGDSFGRGFLGQMLMPLIDSGMSSIGLTGGSFVAAANAIYSQRLSLLSPGTMFDPKDTGQQHHAMGAASAVSSMINGLLSQTDRQGNLSLLPNLNVTQGFNRERIAGLMMRAAGRGMFTSYANVEGPLGTTEGGLAQRLSDAAGGIDLSLLDYAAGDFTGGGSKSSLNNKAAEKVKGITKEVAHRMRGITEALSAMRDLTNEVDGIEDKLDALTNGDWLRSGKGAYAARDAIRTLHGVTAAHNISSEEALGNIVAMRSILQDAAGFDQSMLAMGFNGGGMFGLPAQVELFANVEDMITARGIRGDPMLANRVRQQARQAMARNMNSNAGRGSQVLAYARQMGIVSEDEADYLQGAFSTGDRGIMGSALNRLLTTVFGSAEAGHRFMNDSMQMNAMRQALDDDAGRFAVRTAIQGADAEMSRRGEFMASKYRLDTSKEMLAKAGMRTWQSDEDVKALTEAVANRLNEVSGKYSNLGVEFKAQVERHIREGKTPLAALAQAQKAFANNPTTQAYSELIERTLTRQAAVNNEFRLEDGDEGRNAYYATNLSKSLVEAGLMTNEQRMQVDKMIKSGNAEQASAMVYDSLDSIKDQDIRFAYKKTGWELQDRWDTALKNQQASKEAEKLVATANRKHFGAGQAADAYSAIVGSANEYFRKIRNIDRNTEMDDEDRSEAKAAAYIDFVEGYGHSKFAAMFGDKQDEVFEKLKSGDRDYFATMGRQAAAMRKISVDTLKENGYSLHLSGYWGEGQYSGNSKEALDRRNKLVGSIASDMIESANVDRGMASSLAQDLVSMLLGDKDWKQTLKMYGGEELESKLKTFSKDFAKLEKAKNEALRLSQSDEYREAMKKISMHSEGRNVIENMQKLVGKGIKNKNDVENVRKLLLDNGINPDDGSGAEVMKYIEALRVVSHEQGKTERAIGKDIQREGKDLMDVFQPVKERKDRKQSAADKLLGDKELESYLKRVDLSEEGVSDVTGKLKEAYLKLSSEYGMDKVAAAKGLSTSKGLKDSDWQESALKMMREDAAKGDAVALDTLKLFKAASVEGVTRVTGELTIKNGNEQAEAVLDGGMGGLQ